MNLIHRLFILAALLFSASPLHAAPPELTVLQQQYAKALNERVTSIYDAAVLQLNANYFVGVERNIGDAKKAGDLPTALALEAEFKRVANKEPLPDNDEKQVKPLQKLRATYRAELAKLDAQRSTNKVALLTPYLVRLKQLEVDLTKTSRLAEAKDVMDYREGLATGIPAKSELVSGTKIGSPLPSGNSADSLFSVEKQKKWKPKKGEWKWEGTKLIGEGDGSIECAVNLQPPFVAQFSYNPKKGTRQVIDFDGVAVRNAAYKDRFGIGGVKEEELFSYTHDTVYRCTLVVSRKQSEFYVDGKLIHTGEGKSKKVDKITINSGDGWSPGAVEVQDLMIIRGTDKVPTQ